MSSRIVVLDEVELVDQQLRRLQSLGDVVRYDQNPCDEQEILRRLESAGIAIIGWTSLGRELLDQLPQLKLISVWATGYDYIAVDWARELGITVTNVPAYAGTAVAELTIGMMIALARNIISADRDIRNGHYSWQGFCGWELRGKTLGVVGTGDIGSEVARLGNCFGMRVLAHARHTSKERARRLGVEFVALETLLQESDVISIHVPLSQDTRSLIAAKEFESMKQTAYLVNTTRAGVIEQEALVQALRTGSIAGAALDEITFPDPVLCSMPHVLLTPHIGFYTEEALVRKGDICVDNVERFLVGSPVNVVN